ncbi:sensor histidine kinase [Nocardioides caldifontis]|uniref:sensor histidine kinase n=1 Tax=Nocardioides caldifontis TaxID=2588938 RepID=UPI0011DFD097|nr:ATP-binding protein [Nocardioides caldifontis]
MSALRSPVVLFLATGLLALVVIVVGTNQLSSDAAADEAVADARATSELLAKSVVEPGMPRGLVALDPGAIDRFDRQVGHRLWVTDVDRVKIWRADGTILWSDQRELIGDRFPLDDEAREALEQDSTVAEISNLRRPENRYEWGKGGLLEVYTRIESPEKEPLLFEVYYSAETITDRQDDIFSQFRPITLTALGLVVLVATGLLWALTGRLRRSGEERERLLQAAVDASDAERVRIARDLHDGVVQDLAGATFAVSALARSTELPDQARATLAGASQSLRAGMRGLRSLMVEIYPPDLDADGLAAALDDLLAPAAAQGVTASARVADVGGASDHSIALVWRVAQEAVRNALRHSGASNLDVDVARDDGRLVLTVTDDGRGFDPTEDREPGHFGLRGMGGLIDEAGGRLDVRSAPGAGTTIRLEVDGGHG